VCRLGLSVGPFAGFDVRSARGPSDGFKNRRIGEEWIAMNDVPPPSQYSQRLMIVAYDSCL
jgi:hypothetical protein